MSRQRLGPCGKAGCGTAVEADHYLGNAEVPGDTPQLADPQPKRLPRVDEQGARELLSLFSTAWLRSPCSRILRWLPGCRRWCSDRVRNHPPQPVLVEAPGHGDNAAHLHLLQKGHVTTTRPNPLATASASTRPPQAQLGSQFPRPIPCLTYRQSVQTPGTRQD